MESASISEVSALNWIKATSLGWISGVFLIIALASVFEGLGFSNLQFFIGLGMGISVGYFQGRELRKLRGIGSRWFWNTIIGLGIPFLIFDIIKATTGIVMGAYYILWSICAAGLLTGVLQLRILKAYSHKANIWIAGSLLGWVLAAITIFCMDYTKGLSNNNWVLFFLNVILILSGGIIMGVVTKPFILRILR